jgi:two-component system phosphate regulon sensor histidine kinase PhoR
MTKLSDGEREEALQMIDAECMRVERLSKKMMQLIVLRQTDEIELEEQRAEALLNHVEALYAPVLKKARITLKAENHIDMLLMDEDLLSSLLINLLDNARKASQAGDTIEVTAKDNTISVTDHGAGIPKDALPQVTQPFYMADKSRSRKAGGMGLGLALAEEIARLHGAILVFESEAGKGTTVKVVFGDA